MNIINQNMRTISMNRRGQVESARLHYIVDGSGNDIAEDSGILQEILKHAPEMVGNSVKSGAEIISFRPPDILEIAVNYLTPADESEKLSRACRRNGDRLWSSRCFVKEQKCFETPETQRTILSDNSRPGSSAGYAANWNGRFDGSSRFDGINKFTPFCEEKCRRFMYASRCGLSFVREVMSLAGKLNSRTFRMWQPKEVMLSDISISEPFENDLNQTLVELACTFSVRRNLSDASWGGIKVGAAGGWDHLWGVYYADPRNRAVKAECAYVGRLYEEADFGILGVE